jgi:hypothetical protein
MITIYTSNKAFGFTCFKPNYYTLKPNKQNICKPLANRTNHALIFFETKQGVNIKYFLPKTKIK